MPHQPTGLSKHFSDISIRVLETVAGRIIAEHSCEEVNVDAVYELSIGLLVESLLALTATEGSRSRDCDSSEIAKVLRAAAHELGAMQPEHVGELYERLRGFRLELNDGSEPTLVPCVRGKRNQGLYYTPPDIVHLIVQRTLDHVDISGPADYLDLKILDPAVGPGRFLVEAMRQIEERVSQSRSCTWDGLRKRVTGVKENLRQRLRDNGADIRPDDLTGIRMHVLENCLFGLDIDPVAVTITQAALKRYVGPDFSAILSSANHIRTGNALIGEGNPTGIGESRGTGSTPTGKKPFHWPEEFPAIFSERGGFDAIVGNPPYEILSVKESGIDERLGEQAYFRSVYRTCQGKINTYRIMLERGLDLLRTGGVLGFIVPATLLADSSADKLRRMILDECTIREALVIPETSKLFARVTQSLLILVVKKGVPTRAVKPIVWDGKAPIPDGGVELSRDLIRNVGYRIPVLKSEEEKRLLEALLRFPPLGGDDKNAAVAKVHQGEINLTVHRKFITGQRTEYPLIRGEHVMAFRVIHPASKSGRLDWVVPEFLDYRGGRTRLKPGIPAASRRPSPKGRGTPWEEERIVLGRVVNMETHRRLKAALVPSGAFLGDMTNFIADPALPHPYLLGLLNSRLLNRRIKLTSTNNYISAVEVEALPIPRFEWPLPTADAQRHAVSICACQAQRPDASLVVSTKNLGAALGDLLRKEGAALVPVAIQWAVQEILVRVSHEASEECRNFWNLLDALVLLLYGVEFFAKALDSESSGRSRSRSSCAAT